LKIEQLRREFDRQVENLLKRGYPEAAGLSLEDLLEHIEPLKGKAEQLTVPEQDLDRGRLPFVLVIKSDLVATEKAMLLVVREGKQGFIKLYPHEPKDFKAIDDVIIPSGMAYLLVDIDRGKENINVPPNEAMKMIRKDGRSPITIDEGVAVVTQHPEFLMAKNCFSLLASRHPGDQRVPAIWINAEKKANLGWCWDGNPHTWLGSASCSSRVGA
jgi:hypothetical protein